MQPAIVSAYACPVTISNVSGVTLERPVRFAQAAQHETRSDAGFAIRNEPYNVDLDVAQRSVFLLRLSHVLARKTETSQSVNRTLKRTHEQTLSPSRVCSAWASPSQVGCSASLTEDVASDSTIIPSSAAPTNSRAKVYGAPFAYGAT